MHNMKTHAVTAVATRIGRIACFLDDRRGVSADEFAMLLPLMVTLYLGSVETSQGIATSRKVTLTAHTLADLTTHILRSAMPTCRTSSMPRRLS